MPRLSLRRCGRIIEVENLSPLGRRVCRCAKLKNNKMLGAKSPTLLQPNKHGLVTCKSGKVTSGRFSNLSGMPDMAKLRDPSARNDMPFFMLLAGGALIVWFVAAGELSL